MILCAANAIPLLFEQVQKEHESNRLGQETFTGEQLLFFDFQVEDLSQKLVSRNRLLTIRNIKHNFLLKQPRTFDRNAVLTIKKEAGLLKKLVEIQALKKYITKSFGFDETNTILFRLWRDDVQPVCVTPSEGDNLDGILILTEKFATCLQSFHEHLKWPLAQLESLEPFFETNFPSILFTVSPKYVDYYDITLTQDTVTLVTYALRKDKKALLEQIHKLGGKWEHNCHTLIHGDVKPDNILWNSRKKYVYLIDWELAMIGDPAWDIGGFLFAIVIAHYDHSSMLTSFRNIKLILSTFWRFYFSDPKDEAVIQDIRLRAIGYCGIKIIEYRLRDKKKKITIYEESLMQLGEAMVMDPQSYVNFLF